MNYKIIGDNLPAVICELKQSEELYCEAGAMSWMSDGITMKTEGGGAGKVFGRLFTGESLFRNRYVAEQDGEIAFASSFPGSIRDIKVTRNKSYIVQKGSYLVSEPSVDMSVYIQKRISGGFFGGEGFIMQKFSGDGLVFLEIDGSAVEYDLAPGEKKIVNTGYLVAMEDTCSLDVTMIKGVKNIFLGGEGLFNAVIAGPGKIILQTMPIQNTAMMLYRYMPHPSSN